MHYLITGGAGFIGSHLAEALIEGGESVSVIDDLSTGRAENNAKVVNNPRFRFVQGSVVSESAMDRLASECDVIIHLAATLGVERVLNDPIGTMENNIFGTDAVLRAANRHGKKLLLASTSEIYGKSQHIPFGEEDDRVMGATTKSRWCYAESKALDEFLALAYHQQRGLPTVIFRLFNTVGPRQTGRYGMVIPRFVQQALASKPITVYGTGLQRRCFLHVADAVRAIIALAKSPEAVGQIFNVGSTEEVSILELARQVESLVRSLPKSGNAAEGDKATGQRSSIVMVSYEDAYEDGFEDMQRRLPDTHKIRRYVGWEPTRSLHDILLDVVQYYSALTPAAPLADAQMN